jgi:uncharacterized protein
MFENIPLIDADSHVSEPPDLWTSRLPKRLAEDLPHVEWDETYGGYRWHIAGDALQGVAAYSQAGWREYPPRHPHSVEDADPGCYDPKARLERLDEYGIYAQVLYPNLLGFSVRSFMKLGPKLATDCVAAYNDFLTEFAAADPNRLLPIAVLPFWDMDASVKELHRVAGAGHRGVLLAGSYDKINMPNIWEPQWTPVLKTIEELGFPVNFHSGFNDVDEETLRERFSSVRGADFARETVPGVGSSIAHVANIVCRGLCRDYPGINFVIVESGAGWIPFVMESLDWQWKNHGAVQEEPGWELPSQYIRRQVYGMFWFEKASVSRIADMLPDNIMFETDYPHPVGLAPGPASYAENPRKMAAESMAGVDESIVRRIFFENAARLYNVVEPSVLVS